MGQKGLKHFEACEGLTTFKHPPSPPSPPPPPDWGLFLYAVMPTVYLPLYSTICSLFFTQGTNVGYFHANSIEGAIVRLDTLYFGPSRSLNHRRDLGLVTEFCSGKIPRNRLGTAVVQRKKMFIPRHSKVHGRVNSESRNGTEFRAEI
jgi:hypothetical protein